MQVCLLISLFFIILFFVFSGATPAAYGGSQAKGQIGAVAASLSHSSQQCRILNQPEWGQGSNLQPHGSKLDSLTTELWRELLTAIF